MLTFLTNVLFIYFGVDLLKKVKRKMNVKFIINKFNFIQLLNKKEKDQSKKKYDKTYKLYEEINKNNRNVNFVFQTKFNLFFRLFGKFLLLIFLESLGINPKYPQ